MIYTEKILSIYFTYFQNKKSPKNFIFWGLLRRSRRDSNPSPTSLGMTGSYSNQLNYRTCKLNYLQPTSFRSEANRSVNWACENFFYWNFSFESQSLTLESLNKNQFPRPLIGRVSGFIVVMFEKSQGEIGSTSFVIDVLWDGIDDVYWVDFIHPFLIF